LGKRTSEVAKALAAMGRMMRRRMTEAEEEEEEEAEEAEEEGEDVVAAKSITPKNPSSSNDSVQNNSQK
jgi:hypothetical protein